MIEIQAKLLRGPVYFSRETIQCLITLKNISRTENGDISNGNNIDSKTTITSDQIERICWANVQLHCFCTVDESQINIQKIIDELNLNNISNQNGYILKQNSFYKRNSLALETYTTNDTSFHECLIRGERGIIIYASKPKILFCDLQLEPNQIQTFIYTETLPLDLNPSYSSSRLKYYYKLSIGAQRIGSTIYMLKIPLRILTIDGYHKKQSSAQENGSENGESLSSNNSSFTFDDESKDEGTALDLALHQIECLAGHRIPHNFNITSTFGKVAKFFIFKTVYRLGEDVIGLFDFTDGAVKCIRFSVTLQSEEIINNSYSTKSNSDSNKQSSSKTNITNHTRCQECCLDMNHCPMNLTIPYTVTPSFSNDLIDLKWNLHFSFVIQNNQNRLQQSSIISNPLVTEDGIQTIPSRLLQVQVMTWDFPIQIIASYPAHVAKGFQMASIGTLNI